MNDAFPLLWMAWHRHCIEAKDKQSYRPKQYLPFSVSAHEKWMGLPEATWQHARALSSSLGGYIGPRTDVPAAMALLCRLSLLLATFVLLEATTGDITYTKPNFSTARVVWASNIHQGLCGVCRTQLQISWCMLLYFPGCMSRAILVHLPFDSGKISWDDLCSHIIHVNKINTLLFLDFIWLFPRPFKTR